MDNTRWKWIEASFLVLIFTWKFNLYSSSSILKKVASMSNFQCISFFISGIIWCGILFTTKTIAAIQFGQFLHPIYLPFDTSGTYTRYFIIFYQNVTAWSTYFNHSGLDNTFYSILSCIVYQTKILGYRFSRLGHKDHLNPKSKIDCMKEIIELINLQLENEK